MNILDQIIQKKKQEVINQWNDSNLQDVYRQASHTRTPLSFEKALSKKKQINIIAEIKKASPSKGIIREDFDPIQIANSYVEHGANCLSILTETQYFLGSPQYISAVRSQAPIPILRKDFMVHLRQIREAYEMGADAILLIVGVLNQAELNAFQELANEFGLECLFEVHTEEELEIALKTNAKLIGINNRNLRTFETTIETSLKLVEQIPADKVKISESGIYEIQQTETLYQAGFQAILIGESLMRLENPGSGIPKIRYVKSES